VYRWKKQRKKQPSKHNTTQHNTTQHNTRLQVNNAGATWGEPIDTHPASAFDKLMALNVRSVFSLTQKCLPLLRAAASAADPARVVNIGSVLGINVGLSDT
jgi:NAD(P)-dependent dehydrogenase (short-subunit alcohol dehydrogenase family)